MAVLTRRNPRWAYWPAKIAWAPMLFSGIPLMMHFAPKATRVGDGWRVLVSFTTPDQWIMHLGTFIPGLLLTIAGVVAFFTYQYNPGPGRWLTAIDYPLYSMAAWVFGVTSVLALWRTTGHVADIGKTGLDWRFLAYLRVEPLDYVVLFVASAACLACVAASWGFVSGRWISPTQTQRDQRDPQRQ